MKKWKTSILALLCAAALVLGLSAPPAEAAEGEVLFLALNELLLPHLTAATMPIYYSNSVYVPHSTFDSNTTGVDLGILVSATANIVTLYNKRRSLVFNLDAGSCHGSDGKIYPRAIVRGNIIYLPATSVRNFFAEDGLSYVLLATDYGPLIRFTTPNVQMDNEFFRDAALSAMSDMLKEYMRGQTPSASPSPSVPPPISSSPAPSPTPGGVEAADKSGVRVYLSFLCANGEGLNKLLDTLNREQLSALFFFRPEDLAENEVAIRRMVGSGHAVGLTIPGGPAEDAKAQLAEGNRLLQLIAHTSTHTVTLETADAATGAALEAAGWSVWTGNVPAVGTSAAAYSAALMRIIDAKRALARVMMDDSARSAAALPLLLQALRDQKYSIRLAVGGEVS